VLTQTSLYGKLDYMKDELKEYMDRPKRYDNIDGTGEMAFGLMALGFTLLGYLQTILPKDSFWKRGSSGMLLFFVILLPMFGLILWIPKVIKKRITWPRTGYVKYCVGGKARKSFWAVMAAVAAVSAIAAACLAWLMRVDSRHDWISLLWLGNVAIYATGYAFWIYRMERNHPWKWLVSLFMALGLLVIGLIGPGNFIEVSRPVTLFVGLTWFGSGMATLYLYIRHNQPPAPEAE
jgi:drug/metabolite transporter (DMT)-like permease